MIEHDGPGAVSLGENDRVAAVTAVKALLRVAGSDEDALIAAFAETALGLAEQFLGGVTLARALRAVLPASAAWQRLAAAPVRTIAAVERLDGTPIAAEQWAVDIDAAGDGWVRVTVLGADAQVAVRFEAGLADSWDGLPAPIRQGSALLAAYLFETRDAATPPPAAVTALWRPFRRMTVRAGVAQC